MYIVGRVGDEPLPIIRHTGPLGGVAPGPRCDLHQADGLGGRHVALIEAAFRAHDRINDAAFKLRTDRAIARHTDVRKSVHIHRQTSRQGGLADQQHRLGILVFCRELAEPRDHGEVVALFSEVGHEGPDEVAPADLVENVRSAQQFARIGVRRFRRRT